MKLNKNITYPFAAITIGLALYASSLYSYLLFHSIVELFSIVIAIGIFVVAWNTRNFLPNSYLLFIGISFFYAALIDLIHTLGYKGMGVFEKGGADLSTQLWIAARFIQSISLLVAPYFIGKRLQIIPVFVVYFLASAGLLASIFYGLFPVTFIEGTGLTLFKKISEYIISVILAAAIIYLRKKREYFDKPVLNMLIWSMLATIASEMAFTLYTDAYGFFNTLGHYFKIVSFYLIYAAIITTSLKKPYETLAAEIDRKKIADKVLIESEERFRAVASNTPDHILMQDIDLKYVFVVNPQLGLTEQDMIGKTDYDFLSKEEADKLTKIKRQVIESGKPLHFEASLISKDGNTDFFDGTYVPKFNTEGKIDGLIGYFRNVTERKKAEDKLRKNEEVLRLFVEYSPASIAMFDLNMKYIVASRRYLADYELGDQDLTGRHHYEVFPEMPERWKEIHRRCLAGAIEKSDEDPFLRADGKMDWVRWEIRPWHETHGEIGGIILFSEVITEQKKAEDEIRKLNAELEKRVKDRTKELEAKIAEIERMNKLFVGRELRMVELKERIKDLEGQDASGKGE